MPIDDDEVGMPERRPDLSRDSRQHWSGFIVMGGLLGAAGVALGAAGAHRGGSGLTTTASNFLLIHAAALVGISAAKLRAGHGAGILWVALWAMIAGSVLFSGELALADLMQWRPFPMAAPLGGLLLIAAWLMIAASAIDGLWRHGVD